MATTTRLSLRYPVASDTADVPRDIGNLASDLDKAAIFSKGTLASRPSSTVGSPGIDGRYYYATDNGQLYFDTGTSWLQVGAGTGSVTKAKLATDALQAFPQLLAAADVKMAFGSASISISGSWDATGTVTHTLGKAPSTVLLTASHVTTSNSSNVYPISASAHTLGTTSFGWRAAITVPPGLSLNSVTATENATLYYMLIG